MLIGNKFPHDCNDLVKPAYIRYDSIDPLKLAGRPDMVIINVTGKLKKNGRRV